jgi:hypothetical protein
MTETFEKQVNALAGAQITSEDITKSTEVLRKLERFWTAIINYNGAI